MNFTDGIFFVFLAVLFAAYYITPKNFRWAVLLIGSLCFYYYSGFIIYLVLTIVSTYLFSLLINVKHSRIFVFLWLLIHLSLLAVVKSPLIGLLTPGSLLMPGGSILLPMGISFYTFQCAGYIIDIYRKKAEPEKNPLKLALFVSFFPQLIQGPISRFGDLSKTLYAPNSFQADNITKGLQRILFGFFKKLVIADRLVGTVVLLSGDIELYRGAYALLNAVLYSVVIYCDFTGGIDITIGAARLFGVHITENFNKPFYSGSIAEYWRRWHITMGTWFKDYVFYPLSTSKPMRSFSRFCRKKTGSGFGKRLPVYVTTIITWFLTGLWHGLSPNFIAWGLANGLVIILSQECEPLYARFHNWRNSFFSLRCTQQGCGNIYRTFMIVRTFLFMSVIRSFDIYGSVGDTFRAFFSMFLPWNFTLQDIGIDIPDLFVAGFGVLLLVVAGLKRPGQWFLSLTAPLKSALCLLLLLATLLFGIYGHGYDAAQFIYNRF